MTVRRATPNDLRAIAAINRASFSGNKPAGAAEEWVRCNFVRHPQYQYFVAEDGDVVVGFVGWEVRNGFGRAVPVIELEQLAVSQGSRGNGVGTQLVAESFDAMKVWLRETQPDAQKLRVAVWTKKDNGAAQSVYRKICNQGEVGEGNTLSEIEKGREEVMLRGEHEL